MAMIGGMTQVRRQLSAATVAGVGLAALLLLFGRFGGHGNGSSHRIAP